MANSEITLAQLLSINAHTADAALSLGLSRKEIDRLKKKVEEEASHMKWSMVQADVEKQSRIH